MAAIKQHLAATLGYTGNIRNMRIFAFVENPGPELYLFENP